MKRRSFGLLAGSSLVALKTGFAQAQTAPDASLLKTTLTPFGAERAASADGSIPAWTGGVTTLPSGVSPGDYVPDLFPGEQPVLVIDASNVAQYADRLSEGVQVMLSKYGFKINVFPTHRTAAAPQYVYDNTAKNVATAQLSGDNGRYGFTGAYGGIAFPIPDTSDPAAAGAQIMWNYVASNWRGYAFYIYQQNWVISDGNRTLSTDGKYSELYKYYNPNGSLQDFDGIIYKLREDYTGPSNLVGQALVVWSYTEPYQHPQQAWELLNGQGRVRRAPEVSFDTPSTQNDGICNYDEIYAFNGSLERYDWKFLGKKEMYIPYNNNKLFGVPAETALLEHFVDPGLVRWELHRCWVVEATLHPGERNVDARRQFYLDEDTWTIGLADMWDGNGNLYKTEIVYNNCRPELPGTIFSGSSIHNLQTDDYTASSILWNQAQKPSLKYVDYISENTFDPTNLAAQAQY
jgi:hypothetical protein